MRTIGKTTPTFVQQGDLERWIEWVEPFSAAEVPVYMRMKGKDAAKAMMAMHPEYELNELQALEEFMVVNWACFNVEIHNTKALIDAKALLTA